MDDEITILEAAHLGIRIRSANDIADLLGAIYGADGLLLTASDLEPEFFDLRTGVAGDLFQKLTNYKVRTALVVPQPERHGSRFAELAFEHRTHNMIRFFEASDDAMVWLQKG
jgi:Domain of unknown function (DUF4180)